MTKYVDMGSIHAAGYLNITFNNFLLIPVEQPMQMQEKSKLGIINNPQSNDNIKIIISESFEAPSAFLIGSLLGPPKAFKMKNAMKTPLVSIDDITANNANTNLHLKIPPRNPSVLNTENGPTWRNFVMPNEPVMIEMIKLAINHASPPKPPYTAHLALSG